MHSDQIIIKTTHTRDLIADQFPQFRGEKIVALDTVGTVNAIFRIVTGCRTLTPSKTPTPHRTPAPETPGW